MAASPAPLSEVEKDHFREHGYVHLKKCFTKEQADSITANVWTRLGMDPSDVSTWTVPKTNMPHHNAFSAAEFAPRAWAAICELCGGEDKVTEKSREWRDSLIVNLGSPEFEGKEVRPQDLDNWHVDGDFFVHYLDSPEQALLVIPLYTDIVPGGGGTMICPEGMKEVAKHLHTHPEGLSPQMIPRGAEGYLAGPNREFCTNLAKSCNNFVEVTGEVGDVYLLHPLMLHSATKNPLRKVRIITNPPVGLLEPFRFNREDGDYTLVEQTTLRALGRDSLPEWKITAPREKVIPQRWKDLEKMKQDEKKRMEETKKVSVAA